MKRNKLSDYAHIVRPQNVEEIMLLAEKLAGLKVKMVNSTSMGGGVAEMLHRTIPLFNELGILAKWEVIKGTGPFYGITKDFHNALHGAPIKFTPQNFELYKEINAENAKEMTFDEDVVVIHDPQPAALIEEKSRSKAKWVWRCHIDTSNPNPQVWDFLTPYINRYDASIFSAPCFAKELPISQFMIYPAIDPLAEKNRSLTKAEIESVLTKYKIKSDKPIITQISRFDYLKDPVGVIEAFKLARKHVDCQLILGGGTASDDPEGAQVLAEVQKAADGDPDIHILLLPDFADFEVNAFQRASAIVMQKSLREGFGLTVTEALWKKRPVIASAVGGIPLQVIHNLTGVLVHSVEGAAYQIRYLLSHPKVAERLGKYGHEHVREKFLLTRNLRNYLLLFLVLTRGKEFVIGA